MPDSEKISQSQNFRGFRLDNSDSKLPQFQRILIKLSGEALAGEGESGIDTNKTFSLAGEIAEVKALGVQVAIVVGGGNIVRGSVLARSGMDRATADYMGMLGTIMNALALQDACEKNGMFTRVLSAIEMKAIAEPYIRRRAVRHLEKGRVVIFAGGTGNPYFTTDTTASLRAVEVGCEYILKATKVDGVYSSDPKKDPSAVRYKKISYMESIKQRLKVMDSTALSLCMDNNIPVIVFDIFKKGNLKALIMGADIGTLISNSEELSKDV